MIGKIFGALAGKQAAKHTSKIGGPGGAVLGAIAVPLVSRMRVSRLLLLGAGGYVVKKLLDKRNAEGESNSSTKPDGAAPSGAVTSPTGPKVKTPPQA